jgi:hypothetical protein
MLLQLSSFPVACHHTATFWVSVQSGVHVFRSARELTAQLYICSENGVLCLLPHVRSPTILNMLCKGKYSVEKGIKYRPFPWITKASIAGILAGVCVGMV